MAKKDVEKRVLLDPEYLPLKSMLEAVSEAMHDYFNDINKESFEKMNKKYKALWNEMQNHKDVISTFKEKAVSSRNRHNDLNPERDIEYAVNYVLKNLGAITHATVRSFKNGEPVPLGRPPKEQHAPRKKAERYTSYYKMKKDGALSIEDLKSLTYDDIRKLNMKDTQRVAYYVQQQVLRRDKALRSKGITDAAAQKSFFDAGGGYVKDIRTAPMPVLKSLIRRGMKFIKSETSTVSGQKRIKAKVIEKVQENTGVDLTNYKNDRAYDMFWNAVHESVHAGLATMSGKEKYEAINVIDYYLQGNDLGKDRIELQELLDAWFSNKQEEVGVFLQNREDIKKYLTEHYGTFESLDNFS